MPQRTGRTVGSQGVPRHDLAPPTERRRRYRLLTRRARPPPTRQPRARQDASGLRPAAVSASHASCACRDSPFARRSLAPHHMRQERSFARLGQERVPRRAQGGVDRVLAAELLVDPDGSYRYDLVAEGDDATPNPAAVDQREHQVAVAAEPQARLIQAAVRDVPLFPELTTDRPVELLEIRLIAALPHDHASHRHRLPLRRRACHRKSAEGPSRRRRLHGN